MCSAFWCDTAHESSERDANDRYVPRWLEIFDVDIWKLWPLPAINSLSRIYANTFVCTVHTRRGIEQETKRKKRSAYIKWKLLVQRWEKCLSGENPSRSLAFNWTPQQQTILFYSTDRRANALHRYIDQNPSETPKNSSLDVSVHEHTNIRKKGTLINTRVARLSWNMMPTAHAFFFSNLFILSCIWVCKHMYPATRTELSSTAHIINIWM